VILIDEGFNCSGYYGLSACLSIKVPEELLLPFVHYLVQVFVVALLLMFGLLWLTLLDLMLNGVEEEGVFPGFYVR
jgi:hypothetical protein